MKTIKVYESTAEQQAPKTAPVTQQAGYAEVIECGNSYAKVKLKGEAFGSVRVGDIFYTALQQDEPVGEVVSASCDHATVRWLHQTSSVGGGDPRNSRAWPKVSGVSRDEGHSRALLVFFAAEPTDDEMRAVHDTLAASPTPPAEQQAATKAAPGDALDEAMRERDEAEDFINELLDEVLGADRPEWSSAYNRYDAMNDVRERITALHKPAADKAWGRFESAMEAPQQPAPSAAAHVGDSLFESWFSEYNPAHRGTKQQMRDAYAAGMGDPKAQPSPTPQADSQPAQVRDERDDFEKAFPLPSGCIRVGTGYASTGYSNWAAHTHCERWQGWQARAARAIRAHCC